MKRNIILPIFPLFICLVLLTGLFALFWAGNPNRAQAQDAAPSPVAPANTLGSAFTYQGYLQQSGSPVDGVACDFYFALWTEITGGTQYGTQTINGVSVNEGVFTVQIDIGNVFTGDEVWLETAVQCPGDGGFTTLTPRQPITATPYALGLQPGAVISSTEPVGLSVNANDAPGQIALYAEADQTDSVAIYGNSETNTAVFGNSGTGRGIWGQSTDAEGVYGYSVNDYGVHGKSVTRNGVLGETSGDYRVGVYGITTGTDSSAVRGFAYGADSIGVEGSSLGSNAIGVYGRANTSGGAGVYGEAFGSGGVGVYGTNGGSNTGSWAGYFDGLLTVNGTLSKAGGSFTIDHPLDPENMLLQHSFVESPDMLNVYNGNITLDEAGQAWVSLPDYFEALNQDFRYQLTAVGAPGPNLYIAETVKDNQFKIAGGTPGMTVSWQITGIRHDPWAEANRIEVELAKDESDQGLYLHPEAYGLPREAGIAAQLEAKRPTIAEQQLAIDN